MLTPVTSVEVAPLAAFSRKTWMCSPIKCSGPFKGKIKAFWIKIHPGSAPRVLVARQDAQEAWTSLP